MYMPLTKGGEVDSRFCKRSEYNYMKADFGIPRKLSANYSYNPYAFD
jgi:hypothetical protein